MSELAAIPTAHDRAPHHPSNPLRIGVIGVDHIQVLLRPAEDERELLALVDRLERLLDAGCERVDVVFDAAPGGSTTAPDLPVRSVRDSVIAGRDVRTLTGANEVRRGATSSGR